MTAPTWHATDTDTANLLDLLADDGTLSVDEQWSLFVDCLRDLGQSAESCGDRPVIDPNRLRQMTTERIKPQRVGAFTHRALRAGLVEYTGRYVISTDRKGKNSGKPCRELRWIGGAA